MESYLCGSKIIKGLEDQMDTGVPKYTHVVARSGDSFPAAGCRLVPVKVSHHDFTFMFELRIVSPNGNEFTIETGLQGWSDKRIEPNWMSRMRDRITEAVLDDEAHLDLRENDQVEQKILLPIEKFLPSYPSQVKEYIVSHELRDDYENILSPLKNKDKIDKND